MREELATIEETNVAVGDVTTRCLVAGEGPPLLLLHGLGDNALNWRWTMPALSRTHRVYAPDLPGFVGERMPKVDYSAAAFAGLFAGFLDAVGARRAAVIGSSLGGIVALRLALSPPAKVSSLGLVGSGGLGTEISPALRIAGLPGVRGRRQSPGRRPRRAPRSGPGDGRCCCSRIPAASRRNGSRSSAASPARRDFSTPR